MEKRIFFTIEEGNLVLDFEGTAEEYRAKFDKDKEEAISSYEKTIVNKIAVKNAIMRPNDYDSRSAEERDTIDADLVLQKAKLTETIATLKRNLEKIKSMTINDMLIFELTPIKL